MKPHWDDLETVLALVQQKSLARAAEVLNVTYTTVSRRVARAEAAMGVRLFEKLTDGYRPTEEGLLVAEHAAAMQGSEDALLRKLTGRDQALSGPFTITAPQLIIAHVLTDAIARFCQKHPDVELHVKATNDLLDLSRREAELAIQVSREPGDSLMGTRLAEQQMASFATVDWAKRIAAYPNGPIDWVIYGPLGGLPAGVAESHPRSVVRYRFDDMIAIHGAVEAGLGVARLPMFLGRASGNLVQVPIIPPQPYADIWVVGHADVWPSAKSRAFRAELKSLFKQKRRIFCA